MHDAVIDYVAHAAATYGLGGHVLDIGGRDVNGTLRHLFPDAESYTVVDINEHPTVDIVADAATVRIEGRRFDVVVCTEVLEHTPAGPEICATAAWHLKHGGCFVATMAGPTRRPHGMSGAPDPAADEWYRNVSRGDLSGWLDAARLAPYDIDELGHDIRCVAWKGSAR